MDFSVKTSAELFEYINQIAQELYPDEEWSGLRTGSFEWLQAKITAATASLVLHYLDQRAKNAYIDTATIRQDVLNIAHNLGLNPRNRTGAAVTLSLVASDDVTVPKGSGFTSAAGEVFSSTADLVLSTAGSLSGDVAAVHADYSLITHRASGAIKERVELLKDDVLTESLSVTVNGTAWTKVDDLSASVAASLHYTVVFDELNVAAILAGDGVYGARFPADAAVLVDVYTGGGQTGNAVGAASITELEDSFTNSDNITSITNASAASGGQSAAGVAAIRTQLPAQLRSIAGLINVDDVADVVTANLSWAQDSIAMPGHTIVNSIYVPTMTVAVLPAADGVTGMSGPQSTELSAFLAARGELGAEWTTDDAYAAPVQLEIEVTIDNQNLQLEKSTEIKQALTGETGVFANGLLGFDNSYYEADVLSTLNSISGISNIKVKNFSVVAQPYDIIGTSSGIVYDLELGEESQDGYYSFSATSTSAATTQLFRPVRADKVTASGVKDSSANWLVEDYAYDASADLDDTLGPYVRVISTKLVFKQLDNVFYTNQFAGGTTATKYLMKVSWNDASDVPREAYYHVAGSDSTTLTSTEVASAPISGTGISADFAGESYTNIRVNIV